MQNTKKITDIYFSDLKRKASNTVTQQQLNEMFAQYNKTKSIKIRNQIAECNLRYVVSVAKKYPGYSFPDLVNCGNIGLLSAIEKYDYTKGNSFTTYAIDWIQHEIKYFIGNKIHHIRQPRNRRIALSLLNKIKNEAIQRGNLSVSDDEIIIEYMNRKENYHLPMTNVLYSELVENSKPVVSINQDNSDDDDDVYYSPISKLSDASDNADTVVNLEDKTKYVLSLLNSVLNEREYYIMSRHLGFMSDLPITVDTIAKDIGLTACRVRQIIVVATDKLKNNKDIFSSLI